MENSKENGVKKTFAAITVDSVSPDRFKEALASAQIRQLVTKTYPGASIGNDMQDSLFGIEDFGLEGGKEFTENRVAWISVPKGADAAGVAAMLAKCPDARIYKVLSHQAILTDNQKYAIDAGLTTEAVIEEAQLIKDQDGAPILHNGELQYSAKFFSKTAKADEDLRESVAVEAPAAAKSSDLANG